MPTRDPRLELQELLEGIDVAMLTRRGSDGVLRARPMATLECGYDGDLWFFTDVRSLEVSELERTTDVCVSFSMPADQRYVSVSGKAQVVRDAARIHSFWRPSFRAWFPDGPESSNLALLKVLVEEAQYWDMPTRKLVQLVGFVRAITNRQHGPMAEGHRLDLHARS